MENAQVLKTEPTDNELMQMFADQEDQVAFERLYYKYKEALIRFSYGYTFNQFKAEEIVHDTFLKVHRYKKKYDPQKPFRTWLWTICKNTNLDALDKKPKRPDENFDDLESELVSLDDSTLDILIKESTKEHILEIVKSLPLSQREALLLWTNDHLKVEEMGSILLKSDQAVEKLVHHEKIGLKVKLGDSL